MHFAMSMRLSRFRRLSLRASFASRCSLHGTPRTEAAIGRSLGASFPRGQHCRRLKDASPADHAGRRFFIPLALGGQFRRRSRRVFDFGGCFDCDWLSTSGLAAMPAFIEGVSRFDVSLRRITAAGGACRVSRARVGLLDSRPGQEPSTGGKPSVDLGRCILLERCCR